MKKTIYNFEKKYEVQDDLLNEGALEGLDERTLHETIKAMLMNTTKDCIKYENWLDPDMVKISNLLIKENKTEDDMRKIKNAQDRLKNSLHFAKISENSLYTLLEQMLSTEDIKEAFKQDIPAMRENLYYLVDMEDEIAESITFTLVVLYEAPCYKEICMMINDTMKDLLVNFVGAVVFSILGILYIKNRDEYKFTEEFMPMVKTEEEIEETRQELERLEKVLEQKKQRKQHENK